MKIICFGDSLTFGHGLALKDKWHVIAAKKTGVQMVNRGVSGNTTTEMLARFNRQVILMQPDAVMIMGGYNDIFFEGGYEKAQKNIATMIDMAQDKRIKVIAAVPPPIKAPIKFFDKTKELNFNIRMVNEYLDWLRIFIANRNLPLIDFSSEIEWLTQDLYLDGIHPNAKGNELMANKVISFLTKF